MSLELLREDLLAPLRIVNGVVDTKQTLPILSNVLLKVSDNQLSLTGTDLEVELKGQRLLEQSVKTSLEVTLPGDKFINICKALPENAAVELYQEQQQIVLKSGKSRFHLSTLPADDFPTVDSGESHAQFRIAQNQLRHLLKRTQYAMAQQDVRYYLNGIMLEIMANRFRIVATDGHRLAMNSLDVDVEVDHRFQIIIPRKAVVELLRLLDDSEEQVDILIGSNFIRVNHPLYQFTSKLIEGRFPDYERVIPQSNNRKISINKAEFKQSLQRVAILSNEKFHGVRMEISHNLMRLVSNNPEHETAEEEVAIDYNEPDISIGFNVNYLVSNLNILDSDIIHLYFKDSDSSLLILEDEPKIDCAFVIMPMRL